MDAHPIFDSVSNSFLKGLAVSFSRQINQFFGNLLLRRASGEESAIEFKASPLMRTTFSYCFLLNFDSKPRFERQDQIVVSLDLKKMGFSESNLVKVIPLNEGNSSSSLCRIRKTLIFTLGLGEGGKKEIATVLSSKVSAKNSIITLETSVPMALEEAGRRIAVFDDKNQLLEGDWRPSPTFLSAEDTSKDLTRLRALDLVQNTATLEGKDDPRGRVLQKFFEYHLKPGQYSTDRFKIIMRDVGGNLTCTTFCDNRGNSEENERGKWGTLKKGEKKYG